MYCRNCGKELSPQAKTCAVCGVPPPKGERFCISCGTEVSPFAERCVKCGARLIQPKSAKTKSTAVKLAVLLSFWAWLYTYKKNAWKFWLGLVLGMPSFIIFNWGIIPYNSVAYDANGNYIGSGGLHFSTEIICLVILISLGLWIWAVADTVLKHEEWYWSYHWTVSPVTKKKGS
jgi:ribosomal protein L40E